MANGKPKGNKNRGGKKGKGRSNKGKARATRTNPDIRASRRANADAYTTNTATKTRKGTSEVVPKIKTIEKIKDSTPMRNRDIERLIRGMIAND
tara:strand:+ start:55 stop:336 length:282 start_codon:yes stop_codon:yes gene_type:complete